MQAMAQHMQLGVLPRQELAVHPDGAVAHVEGNDRHFLLLIHGGGVFPSRKYSAA